MYGRSFMRHVSAVLPPPAVALAYGGCGSFFPNILLCMIGYAPGTIHAIRLIIKGKGKREENMVRETAPWRTHQELKIFPGLKASESE